MVDGSNLIKDGDKLSSHHYVISEFIVLYDGEQDIIPIERIYSWKIEYYFDNAIFPIFKLSVAMEPSRYYKIIKNKSTVKFKVRVQMYYTTNDNPDEKSMLRDYINDTFVFYPEDDNSDFTEGVKQENFDDLNQLDYIDNYVEFFLFKDIVTKLRAPCNYVLTGVNMCTAVTYLLYKAGVKNVLMSPFENTKTYGQLVIPPQSVEANIRYLNNNYGFHKKGSMVFFGFLHNYILNCKEGCTAWYKKEWTDSIVYILSKSNTKTAIDGAFIRPDEEKFYTLIQADAITISNSNVASNVLEGVNPTVIDMKSSSTSSQSSGAKDVSSENSNILFNDTSNSFMAETYAFQYKSNNTILTAIVENVNIEAFNPNKKIQIIFENAEHNKKYSGSYRISSAIYNFQHSSGDFSVSAILTFKKIS